MYDYFPVYWTLSQQHWQEAMETTEPSTCRELIDWVFNGTSTQKGQFGPTAGQGNWL